MRKKTVPKEIKSLKTVFIYAGIVLFFVFVSFAIKTFFVIQHSKYDGQHTFTIVIAKNHKVGELIAFNPSTPSFSLLHIVSGDVPLVSYGKLLAVAADGTVDSNEDIPYGTKVTTTMLYLLLHFNSIKTNLTLYDIGRLLLLSKNVSETDKKIKDIQLPVEDIEQDKINTSLFTDDTLSSENTSIQIINATDMPGIGKRLERVITNIGGNVVAVSTAQTKENVSKIQSSNNETYTIKKLKNLFKFPVTKPDNPAVGNITIIIGEDNVNTSAF